MPAGTATTTEPTFYTVVIPGRNTPLEQGLGSGRHRGALTWRGSLSSERVERPFVAGAVGGQILAAIAKQHVG
jgi:hypothetical protein